MPIVARFCRLLSSSIDKCYGKIACYDMDSTGESLSQIRNRLRLSQEEFAKRLGISRQHLSKLENASQPLSPKLSQRVNDLLHNIGFQPLDQNIRAIRVRSWAQAGSGIDFEELPLDWQKRLASDCPDQKAFAVEIQGDSMEPKFFQGDLAVLMPGQSPRNGSLVVARLENEGVVFKIFTAKDHPSLRRCCFTSYNPVFQPIEVPEDKILWNYPVYQVVRQIWR